MALSQIILREYWYVLKNKFELARAKFGGYANGIQRSGASPRKLNERGFDILFAEAWLHFKSFRA